MPWSPSNCPLKYIHLSVFFNVCPPGLLPLLSLTIRYFSPICLSPFGLPRWSLALSHPSAELSLTICLISVVSYSKASIRWIVPYNLTYLRCPLLSVLLPSNVPYYSVISSQLFLAKSKVMSLPTGLAAVLWNRLTTSCGRMPESAVMDRRRSLETIENRSQVAVSPESYFPTRFLPASLYISCKANFAYLYCTTTIW